MATFVKVLIVVGSIFIFVITFLLNRRVKVKSDEEVGFDKCDGCHNLSCNKRKNNCEEKEIEE